MFPDLYLWILGAYAIIAFGVLVAILMPANWLESIDENVLVFRKPPHRVLFPLVAASLFVFGYALEWYLDVRMNSDVGALVSWGGLCFVCAGSFLCFAVPQRMEFNRQPQTYQWKTGLWPLSRSGKGSFDDIKGLYVQRFASRNGAHYYTRFEWKPNKKGLVTVGIFDHESDAYHLAYQIATELHVPIIEVPAARRV